VCVCVLLLLHRLHEDRTRDTSNRVIMKKKKEEENYAGSVKLPILL
jgi:hypothetical protein